MLRLAVSSFARNLLKISIAFGLCVLLASAAFGQSATGRIQGTVTDTTGAVVPGATITVTNVGTAREVTIQSGATGEFSVPLLNPGRYKVDVKAPNFKGSTQDVDA